MPPDLNALTQETITLGHDLLAFKRYYVGMAALLAYDYCLTIGREIEVIWVGKRSLMFYLYVVNRYLPMAFCMVTLSAYFSSLWTFEVCGHFAIVKWFETLLVVIPAETVLVFRTFAITNRNKFITAFLGSIMIVQCFVVLYAMSRPGKNQGKLFNTIIGMQSLCESPRHLALPTPFELGDPWHVCILFSDPRMDTAYLGVSILFDFTVFSLTILHTINFHKIHLPNTFLLRTILRDGAFYFSVILSGNIVWMICALTGRRGIKLINAQPSMILTSIMITRLTLSLRRAAQSGSTAIIYDWYNESALTTTRYDSPQRSNSTKSIKGPPPRVITTNPTEFFEEA